MFPVTDGHEVSKRRSAAHDRYAHHILTEIDAGRPISQRSLSTSLGVALGMTNLLLRRLVRKGWVRVSRIQPNRVGYFLTPTGMAEKARMSRAYFQDSVRLYASARDRLRQSFANLSRDRPERRIVFLGTGEVAEIAFVCLQETDLELVGVIDFQGRSRFFGVRVHPAVAFRVEHLERRDGQLPLVVAFNDTEENRRFLDRSGIGTEGVYWI